MTKEELFKKFNIDESHNVWNFQIDNWMSVEIFRLMNNGELPGPFNNNGFDFLLEFLGKSDTKWFDDNVMSKPNGGSLFLTAKRMVCVFADEILKEINQRPKNLIINSNQLAGTEPE